MKSLLKFSVFFLLLLASASLTGCVASTTPGAVVVAPAPAPYYRYPPRPYYRPYRPYYRPRPARVVVVEPRRPIVVAPRPYYNTRPHRGVRGR
ncbi:hypothetical protein K3G63_17645 [Hymenobacter sp. HSC-4F20]|uniref:hypothetical protein n=1 Tax=Hymenobacter sp. HSC-4F20 TaxID=2864135 RepID=UPI001C738FA7|nr:hypothetical protein [Hymenobacter sp. HSC-4F20]MBX0292276.1 hypothetical protein [Hymenobacter sp. HSC-4F20]